MKTIRKVNVSNYEGTDERELAIIEEGGKFYLQDCTADPNADSLEPLADDSDASVADAIRCNGFELLDG